MAAAAAVVGIAGLALQVLGMVGGEMDAKSIARKKRAAAEFEALQLEQEANNALGAGQRQRYLEERQGKLVQSRAMALAAASGGNASDPTVMNIISGIASESAYRQNIAMYQGEARARQLRMAAEANRMSGEIGASASLSAARASTIEGAGGLLRSGASMYSRYAFDRPNAARAPTPSSEFTYSGYDVAGGPAYG